MAPKVLDPALYDQAVGLRRAGKTTQEAAAEVGMSISSLTYELRRRGFETSRVFLWQKLPAHEVVAAYHSGTSELEVAKRFGVERATIRRVLMAHDVALRSRSAAALTELPA